MCYHIKYYIKRHTITGTLVNGSCNENGDSPPTKLAKTEFILNTVNPHAPITLVHQEPVTSSLVRNLITSCQSSASTNSGNDNNNSDDCNNSSTNVAAAVAATTNADSTNTNVTVRTALLTHPVPKSVSSLTNLAQSELENGKVLKYAFVC